MFIDVNVCQFKLRNTCCRVHLLLIVRSACHCSETESVTALICSGRIRTELNLSVSLKCDLDRRRHNYMQL